jgi:hypothetical protein
MREGDIEEKGIIPCFSNKLLLASPPLEEKWEEGYREEIREEMAEK